MANVTTQKLEGITIEVKNMSSEVQKAITNAVERGLEACGIKAVDHAVELCPKKTSHLANSISYKIVNDTDVYIGTNVEYAPYVEFGTGIYSTEGGRQTPWSYKDGEGNWHFTHGQKPQPYLKPAVAKYGDEYRSIMLDSLNNM